MTEGWRVLRKGLTNESEKPWGLYLGCLHEIGQLRLPRSTTLESESVQDNQRGMAITVTYNMEAFLESCVQRYVELAGGDVRLKYVATPFWLGDTKECPAGAPARKGAVIERPRRLHTFPPKNP